MKKIKESANKSEKSWEKPDICEICDKKSKYWDFSINTEDDILSFCSKTHLEKFIEKYRGKKYPKSKNYEE